MLPFQNLRVSKIRALKEARLLRLGHVNVICGRNNSGKSTLLDGLIGQESRFPGIVTKQDHHEHLADALYQAGGWIKAEQPRQTEEWRTLKAISGDALPAGELAFLSDLPVVTATIHQEFEKSRLRRWAFQPQHTVERVFKSLMRNDHPSVLISPKRQLATKKPLGQEQEVLPNGDGVLDFLFYAKNQPSASGERKTYDVISAAFAEITKGYAFDIFMSRGRELELTFARQNGPWVHATECGLGLQDLLVLLYFTVAPGIALVGIEEPENHIHPDMQRRLLGYIRERTDRQFFISTHSNVFLNNVFVDRVFFTTYDGEVRVDDATSRASMLDDLGYSVADNLVTDVVVLVEGPTDSPVLEELLLKKRVLPRFDVKTWPLGGDIMDQIDFSLLTQSYQVLALLDRDPKSSKVRKRFREKCSQAGIPVVQLKRYAIENYFSMTALREVFGSQVPEAVTQLQPNVPVEDQIHINVKKNNRRIARRMTLADVDGTDLGAFLEMVSEACQKSAIGRNS